MTSHIAMKCNLLRNPLPETALQEPENDEIDKEDIIVGPILYLQYFYGECSLYVLD